MRYLLKIILLVIGVAANSQTQSRTLGNKSYEVSNHLGNVMTVVSDRKTPTPETTNNIIAFNETDIKAFNDYYPYGMLLDNRNDSKEYRYGFNGHEKDKEVNSSKSSSYDFGARIYNSKIARFNTKDPWGAKYSWQSSYSYFKNSPISTIDWKGFGDKIIDTKTETTKGKMEVEHSFEYIEGTKTGNDIIKTKQYIYTKSINIWVDDETGERSETMSYSVTTIENSETIIDKNGTVIKESKWAYGYIDLGADAKPENRHHTFKLQNNLASVQNIKGAKTVVNYTIKYKKLKKISPIQAIASRRKIVNDDVNGITKTQNVLSGVTGALSSKSRMFGVMSFMLFIDSYKYSAFVKEDNPEKITILFNEKDFNPRPIK